MLSTSSSSPWDFEKDRPGILWIQILRFPTTLAQCYQARVLVRPLSTEVDPSRYFFPPYLTTVSQPFLQPRKKARKNASVIGLALSVFASTLRPMYAARFYVDGELVRPGRRPDSSKKYPKMLLLNTCYHIKWYWTHFDCATYLHSKTILWPPLNCVQIENVFILSYRCRMEEDRKRCWWTFTAQMVWNWDCFYTTRKVILIELTHFALF